MSASESNQSETGFSVSASCNPDSFSDPSVGPPRPSHIVGIGASAGGLEALERLFQEMPTDTGMAFVIVQHLAPDFPSVLGDVLARRTRMPVRTVEDQMPVVANTLFLMPPKTEMIISDGKLLLTPYERSGELRLPIDQFMGSLARDSQSHAIAVVLSGTGSDGSRGLRAVHEAGGLVLAQRPETAKFDGMPKSALETDLVDQALSPEEMPAALLRHIRPAEAEPFTGPERDCMSEIFRALRGAFGIDFSHYKPATVARRTEHRLQMKGMADLAAYAANLPADPDEQDALYRDLLIGVTHFFRDPDAYRVLEQDALPGLLADLQPDDDFRVWVAGCATGEEAYSIAIPVHEQIRRCGKNVSAKVFATDVHPRSLEIAAAGHYSAEAVAAVSPERLQQYFHRTQDGYRVSPELRNMVVFAQHNLIKDAPFTRMNLISCRNLLIYFVPAAQNKSLSLFHFGLKAGGILFLGPSESPAELSREFRVVNRQWKIYCKHRAARLSADRRLPLSGGLAARLAAPANPTRDPGLSDVFAEVLEAVVPCGVLVDSDLEIVHLFGDANQYLTLRSGMPSLGLMAMLGDDLRGAVGAALHRAARDQKPVTLHHIAVPPSNTDSLVHVKVVPLAARGRVGAHSLVCFERAELTRPRDMGEADRALPDTAHEQIGSLESELRFTKENLQAAIEELATSNEELRATNEELLAANEELQSTNEELHSVNEELYTVNAEHHKKIEALTELTHDMDSLLESTDVHTIFLDEQLCIRRFTPKMADVFNLIDSDIGRRIHGFVHTIHCTGLVDKLGQVLSHRQLYEEEVKNSEGESFLMRILPYRGDPGQTGVVMTLIDITNVQELETRFASAMEVSPNGMLMVCARGSITQVNSELERIFGYEPGELIGQAMEILVPADVSHRHHDLRQDYFCNPYVIRRMGRASYVWGQRKDGKRIPLDIHVRPISTPHGRQAIASVVDVSQHQELEFSLREQVQQRDHFLATLSHELRNPMGAILTAASVLGKVANGSDEIVRPCDVIRRQASQIALLLDDLLDVARVTQGKITLRLESVDLVKVCHEAIEAVQPLISAHRHRVTTRFPDGPVWVEADRVRLLQIVGNLLTNAIKYTDDQGNIDLTIRRAAGQAVLRVQDDGRGMSADLIQTVFDMFVQSDRTLDRSEGGMGVGLTLVRTLVEMHHGTIQAASDGPGMGSQFTLSLPEMADPPSRAVAREPIDAVGSRRIVLVEDDDDARQMLQELLELYDHQVLAVRDNGLDGFAAVLELRPDVAILDVGLPKMNGFQLARRIREELGDSLRLIALTGYGRGDDHRLAMQSGFDHHLVKPVKIEQLDRILRDGSAFT